MWSNPKDSANIKPRVHLVRHAYSARLNNPCLSQSILTTISINPDPLEQIYYQLSTMADIKLQNVRPMFELRGRNYIVTGGLGGIGYAAVRSLCEMGASVAVLDIQDRSKDAFASVENEFGTRVFYFQTDVTKLDSLNAGVDKAIEALGSLDGCLPCAGINCNKPFVDQSWDEFTRIQEINVTPPSLWCR
jgi:hypothetical protein